MRKSGRTLRTVGRTRRAGGPAGRVHAADRRAGGSGTRGGPSGRRAGPSGRRAGEPSGASGRADEACRAYTTHRAGRRAVGLLADAAGSGSSGRRAGARGGPSGRQAARGGPDARGGLLAGLAEGCWLAEGCSAAANLPLQMGPAASIGSSAVVARPSRRPCVGAGSPGGRAWGPVRPEAVRGGRSARRPRDAGRRRMAAGSRRGTCVPARRA